MQTKVNWKNKNEVREYENAWARKNSQKPEVKARERILDKKCYDQPHIKERNKNKYLVETYGITLEQKREWMKLGCPIGNHPFIDENDACMDHNHITGKNRKLLCRVHNRALGQFHDSIVELQDAINYLKENPQ